MNKLLYLFLVISLTVYSCKEKTKDTDNGQNAAVVLGTTDEFKAATEQDNIQLIDVRTPKEYAEGHLKNAENINFYDDDFMQQMEKLDKEKPVYIYCRSGGRSGKAAKQLADEGFTEIYDLDGGILEWNKKNLPTKTNNDNPGNFKP